MTTLAIDTSTPQGSVALLQNGKLRFAEEFQAGRSHTSLLFDVLERALASVEKLDQIMIGLGPGSYAGVRIAISAAIGLSLARGAALVGIPSIVALGEGEYHAVGDARRESFYFAHVREGECVKGPMLLNKEELLAALAAKPELPVLASEPVSVTPEAIIRYPSASILASLAEQGRSIVARDRIEPIYMREAYITQPKPRVAPPLQG
jgi:tRNA threonylcarbamoyladenosine biosynthesis protein TsaB